MKSKDQILLEEAYSQLYTESYLIDKNGTDVRINDFVQYDGDKENTFKVVGFKNYKIQLEKVQDLPPGRMPHWIWVPPTKILKLS